MALEILAAGPQTTVQEHPGRLGLWPVGVPPSGPMDSLSFQLANLAVGNPPSAAALEVAVGGLRMRFDAPALVALGGAESSARIEGVPIDSWRQHFVLPGQELSLGWTTGPGMRTYLALAGGIAVPEVLGSRATFPLGGFGGHEGRILRVGDRLEPGGLRTTRPMILDVRRCPQMTTDWTLRVLAGPHGAPEYFRHEDLDELFCESWTVEAQSDRTGVRLTGPVPRWSRADGGDAGLHPSNLHDNAYVVGSLIFTGDTPVLIGPDGPSLGGFVSPCVVCRADHWKLGQLCPGDHVRLERVSLGEAGRLDARQEARLGSARRRWRGAPTDRSEREAAQDGDVLVRRCGDRALLVEFGPRELDLALRLRAHGLEQRLKAAALPGVRDLTGGIRSLQVQFDPAEITAEELMDRVLELHRGLEPVDEVEVPGRIVDLPLAWDDARAREAVERYVRSVRPDAPWCPDNIEFIRRVNGLEDREAVREIVFSASYLVLGLGDVYLGAPVAVPLDPRHRLVTTKYSPARTWTPENAVGIGGAYLCVYGMEGPGGYQLFGRTVQVWSPRKIASGTPWLLRAFDQLRFHPVSSEELDRQRAEVHAGERELQTEPATFSLAEQRAFLAEHRVSVDAFTRHRQAAFAAERGRWSAAA